MAGWRAGGNRLRDAFESTTHPGEGAPRAVIRRALVGPNHRPRSPVPSITLTAITTTTMSDELGVRCPPPLAYPPHAQR